MANDEMLNKLAGALRGSKLVREPMRFRMPTSTPAAAAMYLHQVWLVPAVSQRSQDLIIQIDLNKFERDDNADEIDGVDDVLAGYMVRGEFVFHRRGWGRVTFIRKGDGAVMWPERYALQPTFRAEDLTSIEAGRLRLKELDKARKSWCPTIELRWSLIEEAVKSGMRVDDTRMIGRSANLYQAVAGDGGVELWASRLPSLRHNDRPDKDHFLEVAPDRNGVAVRLTARFLANLCTVIPAVLEDGLDFATQYYLRRAEESANEPDEGEEASDEEDSDD